MEWLIAPIALIVGLVIGWWLASRAFQGRQPEPTATEPAGWAEPEPPSRGFIDTGVLSAAEAIHERDPDPDDLQKIEGVGPKIAELLNIGGIYTYVELAATPVERLRDILAGGGDRFRVHDPTTWPDQARLAAEARWDDLAALQDDLDAGRPR